ncbi:MAG: antitoxin Xre/MbcA/ParS toxin-binding domain-containing protein [Planctomycetaceae bacterium]
MYNAIWHNALLRGLNMSTTRKSRPDRLTAVLSKSSPFDDIAVIRKGLPYSTLESLRNYAKLSEATICEALKIPLRTLARRKSGARMSARETELILRLGRVLAEAESVLGTVDKAREWLTTVNTALGGVTPISLLDTGPGFNEVIDVLHRIEYGVFS